MLFFKPRSSARNQQQNDYFMQISWLNNILLVRAATKNWAIKCNDKCRAGGNSELMLKTSPNLITLFHFIINFRTKLNDEVNHSKTQTKNCRNSCSSLSVSFTCKQFKQIINSVIKYLRQKKKILWFNWSIFICKIKFILWNSCSSYSLGAILTQNKS